MPRDGATLGLDQHLMNHNDQIFRADDDRYIDAYESAVAKKAAAERAAATAAAFGGIPDGWDYVKPLWSEPERWERAKGVTPAIIGAQVRRSAVDGDRFGYEVVNRWQTWAGDPVFTESADSVNARAAAIAAIADRCPIRVADERRVTGEYAGSADYAVKVGEWAVDDTGKRVAYRRIDGSTVFSWEVAK